MYFVYGNELINKYFSWTRLQRLKEMRWEIGAILPSDIRQNLSQSEVHLLYKILII